MAGISACAVPATWSCCSFRNGRHSRACVRLSAARCFTHRPQLQRIVAKASPDDNGLDSAGVFRTLATTPDCDEERLQTNGATSSSQKIGAFLTKSSSKYYYEDAELLSRCTSVAERSAIALATMAYERAKRLFNLVSANLNDLESTFRKRLKEYSSVSSSAEPREDAAASPTPHSEAERLSEQVATLQEQLDIKEDQLQHALLETRLAYKQLRALEESRPRIVDEDDVVIDVPFVTRDDPDDEREKTLQQELVYVEKRVAGLIGKVEQLNRLVAGWKSSFIILQKESQHSSEAMKIATQELLNAEAHIDRLRSLKEQQATELQNKNKQITALGEQLEVLKNRLNEALKSLSHAEQQRASLEESFRHEKDALSRSSSSHKDALAVAEKKINSLNSEVASLKTIVKEKEDAIHSMREDARRNANMLVSAAKNREALMIAEKRIEQLNNQVSALEDEVKSRDLVLNDIKEEAVQSTEALRLAAEIKKDLNMSRQRELELSQELERMKDIVKDLRQEVVGNNRAVRAEQALQQLESELDEVTNEVEILRKGIEARDEAIQLMKEEVDRNIDVLSHAAGNRELVRDLEEHIDELKAELRKKDVMLATLETSNSTSSSSYKTNNSRGDIYDEPSCFDLPSASSSSPSASEASKTRKRVTRSPTGYKRTPRQNP